MCGRFALTSSPEAIRALFGFAAEEPFPPRFNIAPGQPILNVRPGTGRLRCAALARWGFSANRPGRPAAAPSSLINARAETVRDKPSFRAAFRRRRCLIPADGFYEWQRTPGAGTGRPFLFRARDGAPLALAGLWETWTGPNGEEVDTACVVTTAANAATRAVHPRLPALIAPECFALWLATDEREADAAFDILQPAALDRLAWEAVGDLVNAARNEGPAVQQPAPARDAPPVQGSLF